MKNLKIEVNFLSSTLIGSGEGFAAVIDTDIVFDELGIPYIPGKRFKGCLRDSAEEVKCMLERSGVKFDLKIEETFGKVGDKKSSPVYFPNLTIEDYETNKKWLSYLAQKDKKILTKDNIIKFFTELRQQTAIDEETGVAAKYSLRTCRIINRGHKFYGEINIENENIIDTLALACTNLRRMGTKRNRGLGEIECKLFDKDREIPVLKRLEGGI